MNSAERGDKVKLYRVFWQLLPGVIGVTMAKPVFAHGLLPGKGFVAGLAHPVGGWDHLLAMVAVGIFSTKLGGRARWGLPLIFVLSMAAGYLIGLWGVVLPFTEWGILLSVVILGVQVAWPRRMDGGWLGSDSLIIILFGLCHGYAHGVEWPQQASTLWFSTGFLITTAGLHVIGVILGLLWQQGAQPNRLFALAGGSIAVAGIALILLF